MTAIQDQGYLPGRNQTGSRLRRTTTHRDLLSNVLFLGGLWAAYAFVRGVTGDHLVAATENAAAVLDLQRSFGLPSESALQAAVLDHTGLIKFSNIYYMGVHFPLTVGLLAWVWSNHRDKFARFRNALVVTTGIGLLVHVSFPLLPPRMMEGFVDTAKTVGPDPYALGVSGGANQLAAMPSLHVGWALLVAAGVIWMSKSPARWLIIIHPVITLLVVVVTANHYWADALVATAIVAIAWWFTWRIASNRVSVDQQPSAQGGGASQLEPGHGLQQRPPEAALTDLSTQPGSQQRQPMLV
jgi:hypothetical protein